MANVNVTYDEMRSAADRLGVGRDEMVSKLNELKAFISSLISSGFVTDQASVRFGETYTEFTTNATETINNLEDLARYLRGAAEAMESTDAQLAAQI
ncbi:WXG100 family type VII secretion target [Actinomycetaceae bacterium WB03_NA08]|uniref:WXG100 family type VII secretion target n=1 Tax=Scrofimicrobium canadense TaxID=2652290 RepID=A0A6N7W6T4_9ACTO|nr:WXG100 family type VII secretion target [Scrofimicrobium canadense]MSS84132.1 WXG100 family type VII secretion target [Scrofimicrobium canadense]